jgi:putative endonuclease
MYYVYAISSLERNYIYVGLTYNIERRLSEHNTGKNKTTKAYSPFVLIYFEKCGNRIEARIKEKYFKSGSGKEKLKIIRENQGQ